MQEKRIEETRPLEGEDELEETRTLHAVAAAAPAPAAPAATAAAASMEGKCTITLHMDAHRSDGSFLLHLIR